MKRNYIHPNFPNATYSMYTNTSSSQHILLATSYCLIFVNSKSPIIAHMNIGIWWSTGA